MLSDSLFSTYTSGILSVCTPLLFYAVYSKMTADNTSHTRLYHAKTDLNAYVTKECKQLQNHYNAPWWCKNAHLQIAYTFMSPQPRQFTYRREVLTAKDGGSIAIDWAEHGVYSKKLTPESPVIVVCHGLTGCSESMKRFCHRAFMDGFRPVVFNKRGHGGMKLSTPRFQPFGCVSDLAYAIEHVKKQHPNSKLVGAGFSAGSGLVVSYVGEYGDKSLLDAVALISPGYDAQRLFNQGGIVPIYNFLMTISLKNLLVRHENSLVGHIDIEAAKKSKNIEEFDRHVYMKMAGHDNLEEYWKANNPMRDVHSIKVPTLCINALDDPVCTKGMIPYDLFEKHPNVMLAATDEGSHCGFFENLFQTYSWCDSLAVDYLKTVLAFRASKQNKTNLSE